MPKKILGTDHSYQKLLSELKKILIEGLRRIEAERLKANWRTGQLISEDLLENQERANYGDYLFERLSNDLRMDKRTLQKSVQFFHLFTIADLSPQLEWTHYRTLVSVKDKQKRDLFHTRAIKQDWTVEQLKEAIRIERLKLQDLSREEKLTSPPKLSLTRGRLRTKLKLIRGKLYSYKLLKSDYLNLEQSDLLVDCGFSVWREIPLKGLSNPKEGEIVESTEAEQGFKFKYSSAKKNQLYTYKAFVEKVTDADTIWVHIDLGFYSHTRQKLRFRGIDAPEISTKKGQKAKEFVEATLSKVSFIIIRSTSLDKYGRPLTDIFYLEGESDPQKVLEAGIFLNQELLDKGLACLI